MTSRALLLMRGGMTLALSTCGAVLVQIHRRLPELAIRDWLISYEHGWVQRGLLGTIARAVTDDRVTVEFVAAVGTVIALVLVVLISAAVAWASVDEQGVSWPHLLLGFGAVVSPVGYAAIGAGLGRLDHVVMLLAATAALVCVRRPLPAGLLLAVALLVHPASILLAVPWVASLRRDDLRAVGMVAMPAMVVFFAQASVTPSVPKATMEASMWSGTNLTPWADPAWMMYMSGVDHVVFSIQWAMSEWRGPLMFGATLVAVAPLALVVWLLLRRYEVRVPRMMVAGAVAPLLLCLIGIDYGRWMIFAAMAMVVSVMMVLPRDRTMPSWGVVAACISVPLVGVATGPVILRGFEHLTPMM